MTKQELILSAKLLRMAADEFSNHGCNDVEPELVGHFTQEQDKALCEEIRTWNGDPTSDWPKSLRWAGDDGLMDFMAYKLEQESRNAE